MEGGENNDDYRPLLIAKQAGSKELVACVQKRISNLKVKGISIVELGLR